MLVFHFHLPSPPPMYPMPPAWPAFLLFLLCPVPIPIHDYCLAFLLMGFSAVFYDLHPKPRPNKNWTRGKRLDRSPATHPFDPCPVWHCRSRGDFPYHIHIRSHVSLSLYTASVRLLSARIISVMTNDINGTHLPVPLLMRCRKSNQTSMRGSF